MKDTSNLLGDGIVVLLRQLAKLAKAELGSFATEQGCGRYVGERSLKGGAELDWDSPKERARLLAEIVADADRLLAEARSVAAELEAGSPERATLTRAAELLSQVLLQDINRTEQGPALRDGVARDRMPSVHDPEVRHGRKSAQKRFDGHKAQIAVDTEEQLITAVTVLAGNAPDAEQALAMVVETEENTGIAVEETVADCAYGSGATRQQFADVGRSLVAKVAVTRNRDCFPKSDFVIDLEAQSCTCPAGQGGTPCYSKPGKATSQRRLRGFRFAAETCASCPLRPQCVRGKGGRSIAVHPQEALLQQARALQHSAKFDAYRKARQAAEHRLARLVQLGIRQARYVGRQKTLFQLLMAATVANLTLLAGRGNWEGPGEETNVLLLALIAFLNLALALQGSSDAASRRFPSSPALNHGHEPRPILRFQMADSRPDL